MNKKIYVRYGFTDLIIDKAENDKSNIAKYVQVCNEYGQVVGESQLSLIGFEDEDGEECNEDGSEL